MADRAGEVSRSEAIASAAEMTQARETKNRLQECVTSTT